MKSNGLVIELHQVGVERWAGSAAGGAGCRQLYSGGAGIAAVDRQRSVVGDAQAVLPFAYVGQAPHRRLWRHWFPLAPAAPVSPAPVAPAASTTAAAAAAAAALAAAAAAAAAARLASGALAITSGTVLPRQHF